MKRYPYQKAADYTAFRMIPKRKRQTFVTLEVQSVREKPSKRIRLCNYLRMIGGDQ